MTARGRQPSRTRLSVVGLFLTIVGGVLTLIYAPHSLQAAGVPNAPTTLITVYALLAVAAIVALGASVAFARQPTTRQAAVWLNATLALVIGLAMVAALVNVLLPLLSSLGAISAGLTALLFLVSAAWDLATSGADITNGDSKRFPRSTRLLLYLAYVMVAALTFTYIGAQYLANGQLVPQYLTDADLVKPGIFALGVPAIILTFILRVGRTWRQRTQAATSAHL